MRKLAFVLSCLYLVSLCSCEKNGCQTFLQGPWVVKYPKDSSSISFDSLSFYKGDSLMEVYRYRSTTDTGLHYAPATYFITDKCDEIDFNGNNTWIVPGGNLKYNILLITPNDFRFRSKSDSSCSDCVISLSR